MTVTKEVKLEAISENTTAASQRNSSRSAGMSSYLLYTVIVALAGGVFVYRKKIQEKLQARKENQFGNKNPDRQKV